MHVLSEKHIFNINNTEQLIIRHLRTTRLFRDVVISLLGKCKYWRTAPRSNKGSLLKQKKIYPVYNVDPRLVRWQNKIASAECGAELWAAASGHYWHLLFVAAPAPDTGQWSPWPLQSRTSGLRNSPHTATTVPPPDMCSAGLQDLSKITLFRPSTEIYLVIQSNLTLWLSPSQSGEQSSR